jgi:hypothetical protein
MRKGSIMASRLNNPKNAETNRMAYIQLLRDHLMNFLNKEVNRIKDEAAEKLALRNQTLLNCKTPSFIFNSKWYAAVPLPGPKALTTDGWNRAIHPDIYQDVYDLLYEDNFEIVEQRALLDAFFSAVLTETQHWDDVVMLIPRSFMGSLPAVDESVFNIGPRLSLEQIQMIKDKHVEGVKCLTRLAMRNLLLSKR